MCIELKIKSKHLALEPSVIRKEEDKLKKQLKYHRSNDAMSVFTIGLQLESLIKHRRWNVRNEARATELARAYLKGKNYSTVEKRVKDNDIMFRMYIVPRVLTMVQKYGNRDQRKVDRKAIEEWSKL